MEQLGHQPVPTPVVTGGSTTILAHVPFLLGLSVHTASLCSHSQCQLLSIGFTSSDQLSPSLLDLDVLETWSPGWLYRGGRIFQRWNLARDPQALQEAHLLVMAWWREAGRNLLEKPEFGPSQSYSPFWLSIGPFSVMPPRPLVRTKPQALSF